MAKRNMDPGLEFMLLLGFKPAKTMSAVEAQLLKIADKNIVKSVMAAIDERVDKGDNDSTDFYSLKNSDFNLSLTLSGAFDGDILRKACNWISNHKDYFIGPILEIGCDCGIMSCFLAKLFPEQNIVAIDRCERAIENGKKLAESLGITNIQFDCCALSDVKEKFDTVFSMRTMHENIADSFVEDRMNGFLEQADMCCDSLLNYAHAIRSVLNDHGTLISFERLSKNSMFLGWINALLNEGIVFDAENYEETVCQEVAEISVFQAFVSYVENTPNINSLDLFSAAYKKYVDLSLPQYEGWDAKIIYDLKRGELIEGYIIEDSIYHAKNVLTVSKHRFDDTCIVFHQNNGGVVQTSFHDISIKDELILNLRTEIEKSRKIPSYKITQM